MKWVTRIDVASIMETWDEDAWDDDIPRVAGEVADALERCPGVFGGIARIVRQCDNVDMFNAAMAEVYDTADFNRVWLGKSPQLSR